MSSGAEKHNATEYNGFYEFVPAGSIDPAKSENDLISFKEQLIEEFEEETQIKRVNIKNIEPYCLIFDSTHGVYDICSRIYINGLIEDLIDSKQNEEYRDITIVNLANIHKEIDKNNCVPTSIVALINLV